MTDIFEQLRDRDRVYRRLTHERLAERKRLLSERLERAWHCTKCGRRLSLPEFGHYECEDCGDYTLGITTGRRWCAVRQRFVD